MMMIVIVIGIGRSRTRNVIASRAEGMFILDQGNQATKANREPSIRIYRFPYSVPSRVWKHNNRQMLSLRPRKTYTSLVTWE